jgi:1-acylglycerone phosphate reductase
MPATDTDVKSVRRMFEVNLFGPMQMVHYFHDMLIRASGAIVNIGSIGGVVPYVYGGMMLSRRIILCSRVPTSRSYR